MISIISIIAPRKTVEHQAAITTFLQLAQYQCPAPVTSRELSHNLGWNVSRELISSLSQSYGHGWK